MELRCQMPILVSPSCGVFGEGYFRLSAFGTYENTVKAVERIAKM